METKTTTGAKAMTANQTARKIIKIAIEDVLAKLANSDAATEDFGWVIEAGTDKDKVEELVRKMAAKKMGW